VGQFKAGGLIMQRASGGVKETAAYQAACDGVKSTLTGTGIWNEQTAEGQKGSLFGPEYPDYILGILIFALTVVAYTTYGGFWAVTWTDVLQGIVIVVGALLLMILALYKVGGLTEATNKLRAIDKQAALKEKAVQDDPLKGTPTKKGSLLTGPGPNNF